METSQDFEKEDLDIDESADFCQVVSDQPIFKDQSLAQPIEVISDQESELTTLETVNPNFINQTECLDETMLETNEDEFMIITPQNEQKDTLNANSEESGVLCGNPALGEYCFEHSISY